MSDPQPVIDNDVDTLRAIAERHANHPEVTTHLYTAADYLAVLHRRHQQESGGSEGTNAQPMAEVTCPMRWEIEVKSLATGNDIKEEICGRLANEPVEYQGIVYVVCAECKQELISMGGTEVGAAAER